RHVPAVGLEATPDLDRLALGERRLPERTALERGRVEQILFRQDEVARLDRVSRSEHERVREHVLELANVAGPSIGDQAAGGLGAERRRITAELLRDASDQMARDEHDVFASL